MAQMPAGMECTGLIRRVPDPVDGRSFRIDLTKAAEARLPDAIAVSLRGTPEALRGFSEEEVEVFVGMLARAIGNFG